MAGGRGLADGLAAASPRPCDRRKAGARGLEAGKQPGAARRPTEAARLRTAGVARAGKRPAQGRRMPARRAERERRRKSLFLYVSRVVGTCSKAEGRAGVGASLRRSAPQGATFWGLTPKLQLRYFWEK